MGAVLRFTPAALTKSGTVVGFYTDSALTIPATGLLASSSGLDLLPSQRLKDSTGTPQVTQYISDQDASGVDGKVPPVYVAGTTPTTLYCVEFDGPSSGPNVATKQTLTGADPLGTAAPLGGSSVASPEPGDAGKFLAVNEAATGYEPVPPPAGVVGGDWFRLARSGPMDATTGGFDYAVDGWSEGTAIVVEDDAAFISDYGYAVLKFTQEGTYCVLAMLDGSGGADANALHRVSLTLMDATGSLLEPFRGNVRDIRQGVAASAAVTLTFYAAAGSHLEINGHSDGTIDAFDGRIQKIA